MNEDADLPPEGTWEELQTDTGNAQRLVRLEGADLRYFTSWKRWHVWDGKRWKVDDTDAVMRRAKASAMSMYDDAAAEPDDDRRKRLVQWALQAANRGRLEAAIALAASEPGMPVRAEDLDPDPYLLNCSNGTLDLRTFELRPHRREDLITKLIETDYDPHARSELWETFVSTVTGGDLELAAYIQRSLGCALLGEWREKKIWLGHGPPNGGKSTFLGAVTETLGEYHVAADADTWLKQSNVGGNRGDVVRLLGSRLVTTSEFQRGSRFDESLLKRISGGDPITAAAKYKDEITFPPTFCLWFVANDPPVVRDDDDGFWSRMQAVPFTSVLPEHRRDPNLREKLAQEEHRKAILAWLVQGLALYLRDGLGSSSAVDAANRAYRREMNPIVAFFDECIAEGGPDDYIPAAELRARYVGWCRNAGTRPIRERDMAPRLKNLGAEASKSRDGGSQLRIWRGVRWSDDSTSKPLISVASSVPAALSFGKAVQLAAKNLTL